ncbi:integrase, catalytic region, zinc finger, CCHC-type containing protein [Tanacetum coccineum]
MLPGENINEYYVRFHKLVNDIRNIRMTMPNIQLNSKFTNNMSPEWDRFVTTVKLNKGLKETNHEQLVQPYSQLSQSQSLQYQSSTTPSQSQNVQSMTYPQFAKPSSLDPGYTQTDEILDTLTKQFALLTQSFRATLPQTNNQLQTSSNTRNLATIQDGFGGTQNRAGNANAGQGKPIKCYNCNGIGHIARNCTQPKHPQNSNYFKDKMLLMQAQENGAVEHEIHSKVQQSTVIDSNNADIGNINVIPYEQYLTTNDVFVVPSCASSAPNTAYVLIDNNVHTPNEPLVTELAIYKQQVSIYEQRAKFELTEREQGNG